MYSMTGYGRGEYKADGLEITVEVKTVNNRYLDLSLRAPKVFSSQEEAVRQRVRSLLTRGHADVYIGYSDKRGREKNLYFDEGAAAAYYAAAKRAAELFPEAQNDITVTSVLRFPEVLRAEENSGEDEELFSALFKALDAALANLNAMRETEGARLAADMLSRMDEIERLVKLIGERAPLVADNYRKKLEIRMKKLLEGTEIDESRLLSEVAVFSDKSNIDEELTRLHSHAAQFREICKEKLVGRKLDFLVQEFNRESNTICSKSNDLDITRLGLALKNEIEKVREQVQNVE